MIGFLLTLTAAIFFPGIILRSKSILSGRKGPGILQPIKDIVVLLKKDSIFSSTTSFIFQIAPALTLASIVSGIIVIPFANQRAIVSFDADFVFFAYMLAMGKFFMIIAALDTGSSFEGMGANREALYSMLVEPAFFILLGTFAMLTGFTSFSDIFNNFHITQNPYVLIFGSIGFYLFVQIMMIENSRLPIDDPKTHLELTMVHEVMILDNSGFDKALIHISNSLKFAMYGALICCSVVPAEWNLFLQIALFFSVQIIVATLIGFMESFRARNKLVKNPQFILTLSAIALIAFIVVLILTNKLMN